jgi:hypothetical protein
MYEVTTGDYEDLTTVGYAMDEEAAYALLGRHVVAVCKERPGSAAVTEPKVRELTDDDVERLRALFRPLFETDL